MELDLMNNCHGLVVDAEATLFFDTAERDVANRSTAGLAG